MCSERSEISGGCLCGAVRFRVDAPAQGNSACHCGQCRRWSGHVWASVTYPADALRITGTPRWFRSSPAAERGFCGACGTSLFWRAVDGDAPADRVAVAFAALDEPTGMRLERHIFTADKGDYYRIADGLPQDARS